MIKLAGFPEFIGYWVQSTYSDILLYQKRLEKFGSFRMFVDARKKTGSGEEISGRIKDRLGKSFFQGIITPETIDFKKTYRQDHSDMNVSGLTIEYSGALDPRIFHGRRHYQGTYIFTNKQGIECHGVFLLEPHIPSRTLEFLMRMDHK